ncbi:exonuclease II Exo2 [Coemansia spiralis]|uniref:Exonuclease II Exo2 n=2 Tax=Coemansia TaxID=4863 RepID=A0A9W8G3H8_9FUNG|nr:exonuclease II Exo2 [Coemansia umbellata]KAJ2619425.1 exonuclease II Exo2 [Coemansia sp. RSA 1358]KAJ2671017.1 exonuclease II Exo2 [Coemansia spiralis]
MGVAGFMRWLHQQFPMACRMVTRIESHRKPYSLFIDLNGTLHQSARQANGDVAAISEAIDHLVSLVKPQNLLYLAIDGVPPRIKEQLQRARREKFAIQPSKSNIKFNSYAITPGTQWMRQVEAHLKEFIERKRQSDTAWRKLRVVFSGCRDPGEGEQKIIEYLCKAEQRPDYHYVWSNDADTVLLSLGTHVSNIILINERQIFGVGAYTVTDIGQLKDRILEKYAPQDMDATDEAKRIVIDDLIFMTFFAGNDFLPPIYSVNTADGTAIDTLWTLYSKLPSSCRNLHTRGEINQRALTNLLKLIAEGAERKAFQKEIGVTALGSQLTALRIRQMEWERQRKEAATVPSGVGSAAYKTDAVEGSTKPVPVSNAALCTCSKHKSKRIKSKLKSRAKGRSQRKDDAGTCGYCSDASRQPSNSKQLIPYVWVGKIVQLSGAALDLSADNAIVGLSGSRPISQDESPKYEELEESMDKPMLTLCNLPLLCPPMLGVYNLIVALASSNPVAAAVETSGYIGGSKAKILQTLALAFGLEFESYNVAKGKAFDDMYCEWKQASGSSLATLVAVSRAGCSRPDSMLRIQNRHSKMQAAKICPEIALVSESSWDVLFKDARTEYKRDCEFSKWKELFYRQHYGIENVSQRLCMYYVRALRWTALYYFAGRVSSWDFMWPADIEASTTAWVAPLASDTIEHLYSSSTESGDIKWDFDLDSQGHPPLLREHMLSVMPRDSWSTVLSVGEQKLAQLLQDSKYSEDVRRQVRSQLARTTEESPLVYIWL